MTTGCGSIFCYTHNFSEKVQNPYIMFLNDAIIFDSESVKSVRKPN